MSGFTIRRFLLQNISAVLEHAPLPLAASAARILVAPAGSGVSSFSLVTEEELAFIRKQREEEAQESRLVLSTRPTRSLVRGAGGAALNVLLGLLLSPLVLLSVFFERIRTSSGAVGLLTAPLVGPMWACVFLLTAFYAAAQQVLLSMYNALIASPFFFVFNRRPRAPSLPGVGSNTAVNDSPAEKAASSLASPTTARFWSSLTCRFDAPCGRLHAVHPLLEHAASSATLRERGLKRLSQRRKREEKRAEYTSTASRRGGADGTAEEDYYNLLGVDKMATEKEIKGAFNRLVLKLHPDRNPNPKAAQQFDQVTKAYRVLSNPEKRKKYDLGGAKGVEDLGAKKREGVRAVFGGDALAKLAGDVFMGSFSQRVIDGIDLTQDEIVILRARALQECRDELLENYLVHYNNNRGQQQRTTSTTTSQTTRGNDNGKGPRGRSGAVDDVRAPAARDAMEEVWAPALSRQLRKLLNVGLAKEVLYVIGQEYKRVVAYFDAETAAFAAQPTAISEQQKEREEKSVPAVVSALTLAARRTQLYVSEVLPHRLHVTTTKLKTFATVRSNTFKSSEAMVDLAWYVSVPDLEQTAHEVALAVLFEPSLTAEASLARRDALASLADVFMQYGQVYKGANKNTMDELMNSLRDYQQQRQREKDQG